MSIDLYNVLPPGCYAWKGISIRDRNGVVLNRLAQFLTVGGRGRGSLLYRGGIFLKQQGP
jgi:hypothetical protein